MGCPQCQSDEISPSGACRICGYQVESEPEEPSEPQAEAKPEEVPGYTGMIEMDCAEGPAPTPEKSDVPEWRQQLSQRLHEIKQKRESSSPPQPDVVPAAPSAPQASGAESPIAQRGKLLPKAPPRKPRISSIPPPRQKTLQPLNPPVPAAAPPPTESPDPQAVRNLIDDAVSRKVVHASAPAAEPPQSWTFQQEAVPEEEGRLILLSRTLSGLIDLLVVLLCTGAFIFAADNFSGMLVLDNLSLILFSLLFLLNFFLYSLFFLSASNQTIGMMITDLRLVGANDRRPSPGQVLQRCCGYLVSLFGFGIGLALGLFDPGSRCLHDRISGTYVVRI